MDQKECPYCHRFYRSNTECDCFAQKEIYVYLESELQEIEKIKEGLDEPNELSTDINEYLQSLIQNAFRNRQQENLSFSRSSFQGNQTERRSVTCLTETVPFDVIAFILQSEKQNAVGVSSVTAIQSDIHESRNLFTSKSEDQNTSENEYLTESCSGHPPKAESLPLASTNALNSVPGPSGISCKRSKSKSHACSNYGKKLLLNVELQKHSRIHSGEKPFQCLRAKGDSERNIVLNTTPRRISEKGRKNFICATCDEGFCLNISLTKHIRLYKQRKAYKCKICGQELPLLCTLEKHLRSHSGVNRLLCDFCVYESKGIKALLRHRRSHWTQEQ